jgi:hypothetical protein
MKLPVKGGVVGAAGGVSLEGGAEESPGESDDPAGGVAMDIGIGPLSLFSGRDGAAPGSVAPGAGLSSLPATLGEAGSVALGDAASVFGARSLLLQ